MEAFVYVWTDHRDNKLYVGSHKGTEDDGYVCTSKLMLEEYKERPGDFTRQVIAHGKTEDIRGLEYTILRSANASRDKSFYNLRNCTSSKTYCKQHTKAARLKMSANHADVSGAKNPNYGKKHSEAAKLSMSLNSVGDKNGMFGRKQSQEVKDRIAASKRGKPRSEATRLKISETKRQRRLDRGS